MPGEPLMAVSVVGGALLGIGKDAVGFGRFLKLLFGGMIARIAVGMILQREFAVGALQFLLPRAAGDAEHFVIIAFRHRHCTSNYGSSGPHRDPTMEGRSKLAFEMVAALEFAEHGFVRRRPSSPRARRPGADADRTASRRHRSVRGRSFSAIRTCGCKSSRRPWRIPGWPHPTSGRARNRRGPAAFPAPFPCRRTARTRSVPFRCACGNCRTPPDGAAGVPSARRVPP